MDFFNSLSEVYDAELYFEFSDPLEQTFNQQALQDRLRLRPHLLRPGWFGLKNLRVEVLSILRKKHPEMVFISEYNLLGLLVCIYKLLFQWNLRIVTICDDNLLMAQQAGRIKRLTRYVLLHVMDGVILADEKAYHWYQAKLPYRARYVHFPIIQSDEVYRLRLQEALPLAERISTQLSLFGKQLILYVGRLAEVKQVSLLIDSFQRIAPTHPKAALLVVGDGPLRQALEKQAATDLQEKRIHFVGKQEGIALLAYYNIAQLFVLPSRYEPFGTVVNEALLSGCYTLCSAVAGATCLIKEGENGSLFDPSQPELLAKKLQDALADIAPLSQLTLKPNRMTLHYSELFARLMAHLSPKG